MFSLYLDVCAGNGWTSIQTTQLHKLISLSVLTWIIRPGDYTKKDLRWNINHCASFPIYWNYYIAFAFHLLQMEHIIMDISIWRSLSLERPGHIFQVITQKCDRRQWLGIIGFRSPACIWESHLWVKGEERPLLFFSKRKRKSISQ